MFRRSVLLLIAFGCDSAPSPDQLKGCPVGTAPDFTSELTKGCVGVIAVVAVPLKIANGSGSASVNVACNGSGGSRYICVPNAGSDWAATCAPNGVSLITKEAIQCNPPH
jgi:hypothetical protein